MKPAFSVIFLTTLIGAGQGLFLAYYSAEWLLMLNILQTSAGGYIVHAAGLSFLLMAGGLVASFFHLGHPERAWRAAAMWRTSWLSREVIALPLAMGTVLVFAMIRYFGIDFQVLAIGRVPLSLSTIIGFCCSACHCCAVRLYRHDLRQPEIPAPVA